MSMFGLKSLPQDHRLGRVYRFGAALTGVLLLIFGILGYAGGLGFFDTEGDTVAGLSTNGVLSTISVVVGVILIAGAVIGGNLASDLNVFVGVLFMLSGLANLCVLRTSYNFLNFSMANVIFSFVVGTLVFMFGLYGRASGGLAPDNPFYRARHGRDPATGEVVDEQEAARSGPRDGNPRPAPRAEDADPEPRRPS
ncbi:MAG TPA: DUF4383 domain-containing protein [Mycobacteriales bacterium]|jgi:hypothetical protein|nr:DUF4383 domain-containing protein [Mycobacteriales bacterium]